MMREGGGEEVEREKADDSPKNLPLSEPLPLSSPQFPHLQTKKVDPGPLQHYAICSFLPVLHQYIFLLQSDKTVPVPEATSCHLLTIHLHNLSSFPSLPHAQLTLFILFPSLYSFSKL